jgi:hypothetical protein
MAKPLNFPEHMRLRLPQGLRAAIQVAAAERYQAPAEWARQALVRILEADGIALFPNGGRVGPSGKTSSASSAG